MDLNAFSLTRVNPVLACRSRLRPSASTHVGLARIGSMPVVTATPASVAGIALGVLRTSIHGRLIGLTYVLLMSTGAVAYLGCSNEPTGGAMAASAAVASEPSGTATAAAPSADARMNARRPMPVLLSSSMEFPPTSLLSWCGGGGACCRQL